ncbi:hypothetical protein NDU88_005104 [Pleurodeles waltl]|uniref:Uncharacterized protein n=1 Tax=Pleurodeles waltl TaxID=8319 RepID=A0AAV7UH65_PLEWA|nr:hypothetical protein NDU88_005104 [Pleurodeles waltl]
MSTGVLETAQRRPYGEEKEVGPRAHCPGEVKERGDCETQYRQDIQVSRPEGECTGPDKGSTLSRLDIKMFTAADETQWWGMAQTINLGCIVCLLEWRAQLE